MSQGHKWRRGVKVVVTDGSRTYKASVDACLPHARHVPDRFHVIRWFCAGLTAARRDIQRREPHGVKPAFDPEVFRARFLLLRRGDTLTGADQAASTPSLTRTRGSKPAGRPYRNSTASTSPTTTKAGGARIELDGQVKVELEPLSGFVMARRVKLKVVNLLPELIPAARKLCDAGVIEALKWWVAIPTSLAAAVVIVYAAPLVFGGGTAPLSSER